MTVKSGPECHVQATFRAPIDFVFRWCTDFSPADARLEGESYDRRVLSRTPRRVVYEDLEWTPGGWHWGRYTVTLRPPTRWTAERVGNYLDCSIRYTLARLPDGRTRLDLRWHRRPTGLGSRRWSKTAVERGTTRMWKRFAAALEADFRRAGRT